MSKNLIYTKYGYRPQSDTYDRLMKARKTAEIGNDSPFALPELSNINRAAVPFDDLPQIGEMNVNVEPNRLWQAKQMINESNKLKEQQQNDKNTLMLPRLQPANTAPINENGEKLMAGNLFDYFTELDRKRELAKRGGAIPPTMERPVLGAPPPHREIAFDPFAQPEVAAATDERVRLGTPPVIAPVINERILLDPIRAKGNLSPINALQNYDLPPIENTNELAKLARLIGDNLPTLNAPMNAPALTAPVPQSAWQSVAPPEQPFALPPSSAPGMAESAPFDRSGNDLPVNGLRAIAAQSAPTAEQAAAVFAPSSLPPIIGEMKPKTAAPPSFDLPMLGANETKPKIAVPVAEGIGSNSQPSYLDNLPKLGEPAAPSGVNSLDAARLRQARAQRELDALNNKDFSIKKDDAGNVIHRGKDRDSDHNWWDSVKSGLLNALSGAGEGARSGGGLAGILGGALGGFGAGAVGGARDRNYDEKTIDNSFRRPSLERRNAQANEMLEYELKAAGLQQDLNGQLLTNQGKRIKNEQELIEYVRAQNPKLWDSIIADNQITDEESKMLQQAGYGATVAYDGRKFNSTEKNGVEFATPALGAPKYKPVETLPIERSKTEKEFTLPSGEKYYLSQSQAANIDKDITVGDFNRAWETTKKNLEIKNENIQANNTYERERNQHLADEKTAGALYNVATSKYYALSDELGSLEQQLAAAPATVTQKDDKGKDVAYQNPDRDRIGKAIEDKKKEIQNASSMITQAQQEMRKAGERYQAMPKPMAQDLLPAAPKLGSPAGIPKMTRGAFVSAAKAKGITGANLRRAVEKAIADGIIR